MDTSVEKWKGIAQSELYRLGAPLPVELVLAIVRRESNGTAGAVNPKSGASGLMQVMPVALKDYNQNHSDKYTMADLRNTDQRSAKIQIRVGVWILIQFFRSAYRYLKSRLSTVSLDDLVKITDTFYAAGPANSKGRLNKIVPTWENVKSSFPTWDRIKPAELIWQRSNDWGAKWDLSSIDSWLESNLSTNTKKTMSGAIIGIIIILIAWQYFGRSANAKRSAT